MATTPESDKPGLARTGPQSGAGRPASVAGVPLSVVDLRSPGLTNPSSVRALSAESGLEGIPPAPAGTYELYREIRSDDTVALARMVVMGPILATSVSFEKSDPDVPDEWRDFVRSVYEPLAPSLVEQLLRSQDFGSRSFEQIYQPTLFGGKQYIGIKKFKPLRPDNTEVLVDVDTGEYAGLRNGDVELDPEETLHFAYDNEDDNYYGRSRFEGVREKSWWPYEYFVQTVARIGRKVSNIIPIVKGPLGSKETDADGQEISGYDVGAFVLNALVQGDGVLVENLAAAIDQLLGSPELAKASKWDISSFDTGSSSSAVEPLIGLLRYYDSKKMRGMLRPERTATEGQSGTKAEVAEQADVGLAEGEYLSKLLWMTVNWHSVNRLLVWNFGERAENAVRIVPDPLIDEKKAVFRWVFTSLLANSQILDVLATRLDLDAMSDRLGIPTQAPLSLEDDQIVPPSPLPAPLNGPPGIGVPPLSRFMPRRRQPTRKK